MAAARYVAMNPVRARLVGRAEDWPWSSVRAHLAGRNDGLAETIGRPLGPPSFLDRIATLAGRDPRPRKRVRKPRREAASAG